MACFRNFLYPYLSDHKKLGKFNCLNVPEKKSKVQLISTSVWLWTVISIVYGFLSFLCWNLFILDSSFCIVFCEFLRQKTYLLLVLYIPFQKTYEKYFVLLIRVSDIFWGVLTMISKCMDVLTMAIGRKVSWNIWNCWEIMNDRVNI